MIRTAKKDHQFKIIRIVSRDIAYQDRSVK